MTIIKRRQQLRTTLAIDLDTLAIESDLDT